MPSTKPTQLIASRYEILDVVGRGGFGIVYRCLDRVTRREVALKQMLTRTPDDDATQDALTSTAIARRDDYETAALGLENETAAIGRPPGQSTFIGLVSEGASGAGARRLALSNEFELLARLRHPHIISVLDYGFDGQKRPFFTMPLLRQPRPITQDSHNASLDQKIQWLAEMLQALVYLHHHKIIHRDLKPDNALLNGDGVVKVLDFGLAMIRERANVLDEDDSEVITGTIAYMSPELLQGEPPSERSDLYAFGLIAYELLAGRYPFDYSEITTLITGIIAQAPPIDDLDISDDLKWWMEGLLAKDPAHRPATAMQVLQELIDITAVAIPLETRTIQESYMQTARFVGRDQTLRTLLDGLRLSIAGEGSTWLIIGAEGAGKTRLLNELRVRALVNGVQVLQGHGSQGSRIPYQILREPVRRLLLSTPVDDGEAFVLKTLLPEIETLLGRAIPAAKQDEMSKYADQLSGVVLRLFQQQEAPTLLMLDDLHWSPESAELIRNLVATVPQTRLMIVATLRPGSALDHSDDLNEMQPLRLERLADQDVIALARSILGDAALRPDVQEVLRQEARGNVNFLLEVIRALLNEVQHLRDIAKMRPPAEITAGGINRVLAQRLAKIHPDHRPLFTLLIVAGLDIDLRLLNHFAAQLAVDTEQWFAALVNQAIVEREGEVWQFAHERLRSVALEQIPAAQLPALHTQLAEALETLYPDSVEKAGMIAFHWRGADNPKREHAYILDAAEYALRLNSFQDATRLYERALALQLSGTAFGKHDRLATARLHIKLGESQTYIEEYDSARKNIETGLILLGAVAHNAHDRARGLALLADIAWRTGQFDEAQTYSQDVLALAEAADDAELVTRSLWRMGMVASEQGAYARAEDFYTRGLALAQTHDDDVGLGVLNNNFGILSAMQGDLDAAKQRFEASLAISERNQWTYRMASTLNNLGSIAGMQGDLDGSRRYLERSLLMARSIGDRRGMTEALHNLAFVAQLQENYVLARQYYEDSLHIARTTGNRPALAHVYHNLAKVFEQMGELDRAWSFFRQATRQAYEIQAWPVCLKGLADLARLEDDPEKALMWATSLLAHETTPSDARAMAQAVVDQWRDILGDAVIESIAATAAQTPFAEVMAHLLAHNEAS